MLRALIDFTLSNARRFYSSMGNLLDGKGLTTPKTMSLLKQLISSSFTSTKRLAAILKNRLGDYRVILTSTSTNQQREFSRITYVFTLKMDIDTCSVYAHNTIIIYPLFWKPSGRLRGVLLLLYITISIIVFFF